MRQRSLESLLSAGRSGHDRWENTSGELFASRAAGGGGCEVAAVLVLGSELLLMSPVEW